MRILDDTLEKLLIGNKVATEQQIAPLREEAVRSSQSLQDTVLASKLIDEAGLTKLYAEYADIPYI